MKGPDPEAPAAATPAPVKRGPRVPERYEYPREGEAFEDYAKRCPRAPIPLALLNAVFDQLLTCLKVMNEKNKGRNERLDVLEARLAALDARPELKYMGSHREDASYPANALVTRRGGLWLATEATDETPGDGPTPWKLIVKERGAES